MTERVPAGRYTVERPALEARIVDIDFEGHCRVQMDAHPVLTAFLDVVEPEELFHVVQAVAASEKYALAALPAYMGGRTHGWLLDATDTKTYTLWAEETDRAFQGDARILRLALELYARAVLRPWDGLLSAKPGQNLDGKAPAWVDQLRGAQVQLLIALDAVGLPLLEASELGHIGQPFPVGRYSRDGLEAEVFRVEGPGGTPLNPRVKTSDGVLSEFLYSFLPLEIGTVLDPVLKGQKVTLKATPKDLIGLAGIRCGWTAEPNGDYWWLRSSEGAETRVPASELLSMLELYARSVLAIFEGAPVRDPKGDPKGKVPPWVGKLRRLHARARGRVPDRLLEPQD